MVFFSIRSIVGTELEGYKCFLYDVQSLKPFFFGLKGALGIEAISFFCLANLHVQKKIKRKARPNAQKIISF